MINLLPENKKREIVAGGSNVLLLRYTIALAGIAVAAAISLAVTIFMIDNIKQTSLDEISKNDLAASKYGPAKQSVQQFRGDLQTVKTILGQKINYSTALLRISNLMPKGVVLDQIDLGPETFDKPTELIAYAKSEQAGLDLKKSIAGSQYFSNVRLASISQQGDRDNEYSYVVSLTLTISRAIANE